MTDTARPPAVPDPRLRARPGARPRAAAGLALVTAAGLLAPLAAAPAAAAAGASADASTDVRADVRAPGRLAPLEDTWGDDTTREDEAASRATGTWSAPADQGSAFVLTRETGAQAVWAMPAADGGPTTGRGVGVAILDTGIAPVAGLDAPGAVVEGPDLSLESQSPALRGLDGFGHGTHMAGLVGGRDAELELGEEVSPERFSGMAPGATLVDVKLGTADGAVDVSQVVAALDWVVEHRAETGVRVVNLSYGTGSTQPADLDPLAHAVESAWRAGVVVVVAAGNDGEGGPSPLTMPAADPWVLAVGSSDHRGTPSRADDAVGAWTSSGTDARRPDLLAPGKSVVSLRVPGSLADVEHPEGRVTGDAEGRFFRGTGTSQSAAVVSGAAALLLQRDPSLTPDQVKGLLVASAEPLAGDGSPVQGAGELDVLGAVQLLDAQRAAGGVPAHAQQHAVSTGLGSLEASRGGVHVVDPGTGAALTGEQDVFGVAWDAPSWAAASSAGTAWDGGAWRGSVWAADGWAGPGAWGSVEWQGASWTGRSWRSTSWTSAVWEGRSWRDQSWTGRSWRDESWSGRSWRGYQAW
ncbi:S8 family serine peptidase [uncultured Pseudokineococcus sp.]|uniref:S8 family serine peptidase n=1 Tax=uncultured Pseudokineococcus sp. TaxID=1642928 RepID=UPI00261D1464|nr:S8 family serine peptidase [uncultured Pseudokineococcus sp.]